jgi:hypothetical protein
MKQSPELDRAQDRMRPGVIARDGFLGSDSRNLADILDADDRAVRRLGLDHEGIARRMRELRAAGEKGLGLTTSVPPHFEVTVEGVRGSLPCPFGHEGLHEKTTTVVRNRALDRETVYSDLSIHLIEAHGFYQGRGSPFRLDPTELARTIEVGKE